MFGLADNQHPRILCQPLTATALPSRLMLGWLPINRVTQGSYTPHFFDRVLLLLFLLLINPLLKVLQLSSLGLCTNGLYVGSTAHADNIHSLQQQRTEHTCQTRRDVKHDYLPARRLWDDGTNLPSFPIDASVEMCSSKSCIGGLLQVVGTHVDSFTLVGGVYDGFYMAGCLLAVCSPELVEHLPLLQNGLQLFQHDMLPGMKLEVYHNHCHMRRGCGLHLYELEQ